MHKHFDTKKSQFLLKNNVRLDFFIQLKLRKIITFPQSLFFSSRESDRVQQKLGWVLYSILKQFNN